jgi:hypothetical protein
MFHLPQVLSRKILRYGVSLKLYHRMTDVATAPPLLFRPARFNAIIFLKVM